MMTPFDLVAGVKVHFDTCKRFSDHDFLLVVFTFQSPKINNKGGLKHF